MRPFQAIVVSAALLAILIGTACTSSTTPVAAGGSSETVLGRIVDTNGHPVGAAPVHLRPSDYVSTVPPTAGSTAITGVDAVTDDSGRFEIDGIMPGDYRIEVNDGRLSVLTACTLRADETRDLGVDTAHPNAALVGTIDSFTGTGYVQVYGLERLITVDSSGRFACHDLPRGVLTLRITAPGVSATPIEIANVKTAAGDTTTVPVFVTSDPNGGWNDSGYYVHNNMWNSSPYQCTQILYVSSYRNWYVTARMDNATGDGAVKTYPNVHKDFSDVPIGSFTTITSAFAATSPHLGIYNVAYSIWTNGVAKAGSTELMIWTENFNQTPAGSQVTTVTLGGRSYHVWKKTDNRYIAFVAAAPLTSGTVDVLEIFNWTISQGWLAANSTLGQIGFGVEIVSTNGADAVFKFTDFSITAH